MATPIKRGDQSEDEDEFEIESKPERDFPSGKIDEEQKKRLEALKERLKNVKDRKYLERELEGKVENNGYFIKSKVKNNETSSEYAFSFRTVGYPLLRVLYREKSSDSKSRYSFAVGFFEIVEFNDANPIETSTSRIRLNLQQGNWGGFKTGSGVFNGVNYKSVNNTWTSKNTDYPDLKFFLQAYSFADAVNTEQTVILPNTMKYSLGISGWTYKLEGSDSKLALRHILRTKSITKNVTQGLDVEGGKFTWAGEVETIGGKKALVKQIGDVTKLQDNLTKDSDEDGQEDNILNLVFDENRPVTLYWDPELTVADPDIPTESAGFSMKFNSLLLFVTIFINVFLF